MLAGEDGPGGIAFSDFNSFLPHRQHCAGGDPVRGRVQDRTDDAEGGVLAGVGDGHGRGRGDGGDRGGGGRVVVRCVLGRGHGDRGPRWQAPTDAAAVNLLLRQARVAIPDRLTALLEIESGLNDPMSVFLTVLFVEGLVHPGAMTPGHIIGFFALEMGGGAVFGLVGGYALLALLRRLPAEASIFPILTFAAVLTLFGAAQVVGASGFLAVYLMGIIAGTSDYKTRARMEEFYEAFAWLAQIALFLLLGLLVTPSAMMGQAPAIAGVAVVLILVARPAAAFACLLPFGFGLRGSGFAAWVGLRGAVPIYLTIIPVLQGMPNGERLFGIAFGTVVASLVVQGWTIGHAASLLGYGRKREG